MKNSGFQKRLTLKLNGGKHQCEAGYCIERACVDYSRHVRLAGIPGEVRYLCCTHAPGLHKRLHEGK